MPVVDEENRVIGIRAIEELVRPHRKPNKVILMVGGLGTRLRPLTEETPKPMLKVGNKPILQTIVETFAQYGFTDIVMCVNYKSDVIRNHFGDGSVRREHRIPPRRERMGCGGSDLLSTVPDEPFSS